MQRIVATTIKGAPDNNSLTTDPIDTTGADTLIALVTDNAILSYTFDDSKSNTWVPLTRQGVGSKPSTRLFYASTAIVGTAHTFTATTALDGLAIAIIACRLGLTGRFNGENGATSDTATTFQPGAVAPPASAGFLIVTGIGSFESITFAIDSGFTISGQVPFLTDFHIATAMAYKFQTIGASVNPTWSWDGSSARVAASIASFQNSALGSLFLMYQ